MAQRPPVRLRGAAVEDSAGHAGLEAVGLRDSGEGSDDLGGGIV